MNTAYSALAMIAISLTAAFAGVVIRHEPGNNDDLLINLGEAIAKAHDEGVYNCCMDPPCTQCYLGEWKYDPGTCECDAAESEGRYDDICPQCRAADEAGGEECSAAASCALSDM